MPTTIRAKRRRLLGRWTEVLAQRLPTLSGPEAAGLARWSVGIVLAKSASLHACALALACWLGLNPLSLRKRLREWYLEARAKKGHGSGGTGCQRRDFDPHDASPDLLRWILEGWPCRQLALALDPTNFSDRFTVLNVSVLYRGCAEEQSPPGRPGRGKRAGEDTPPLPDFGPGQEQAKKAEGAAGGSPKRTWSAFARGWNVLRDALAVGLLVVGSWLPEPWPSHPAQGLPPTPAADATAAGQPGCQARPPPAATCSIPLVHEDA